MYPSHRTRLNPATETITNDQIIPFVQSVYKNIQAGEVVRIIGIPYDYEIPPGCAYPCDQGPAVSSLRYIDHKSAMELSPFARIIRTPVVGDNHLAVNVHPSQSNQAFINAAPNRPFFIQAGHNDGYFHALITNGFEFHLRLAFGPLHQSAPIPAVRPLSSRPSFLRIRQSG
jgi:hypothetical protein